MKHFLFTTICCLIFLPVGGVVPSQKIVVYGNVKVLCPVNWTSECNDVGTIGKTIMLSDGKTPNELYMLFEYNFDSTADYIMTNAVVENPNVLFKGAKWGPRMAVKFNGMDAQRITYSKVLFDVHKDGIAYAFCKGKKSYVVLYLRNHGTPDKSSNVLSTYRLIGKEDDNVVFATAYEEITHFITSMKESGAIGRSLGDGVILKDLVAHDNPKELVFTYQVDFIDKSELDKTEIANLEKEWSDGMKNELKNQISKLKPYARCRNEGFLFRLKIMDVKANIICTLKYTANELR